MGRTFDIEPFHRDRTYKIGDFILAHNNAGRTEMVQLVAHYDEEGHASYCLVHLQEGKTIHARTLLGDLLDDINTGFEQFEHFEKFFGSFTFTID